MKQRRDDRDRCQPDAAGAAPRSPAATRRASTEDAFTGHHHERHPPDAGE